MKRIIMTAAGIAAAAAFAMPSSAPAQDIDIYINDPAIVACPEGVTECVRDWVNWTIDRVNGVGPIIGGACEVIFPDCDSLLGE